LRPAAEFEAAAGVLGANRRGVAAHLQELWDSGARFDAGFTALGGVADGGSYARTLNSLSGQTVGAIAAARYSASHSFVTTMLDGCPTYEQAGITDAEEGCGWARIIGRQTDQNATGDALGYQADAWTMQTGAQVRIAPNWFLGGSVAYESSDFRGDGGIAKVNGDSLLLGTTLRYQNGPWQLSGAVDFGHGWYDSRRTVQVGSLTQQASANPRAWQAGVHTRIAYQIPFEGWYLQPRLDLHVNHVRSGGYTENGAAPFNLTVDGQSETGFAATPALEVGGRVPLGDGMVLRPYASAGFSVLSNGDWTTTARFAGQPNSRGFRASTPMPDTLAKFSVGAELLSGTNWDFKLQYSADLGDGYASHAGIGRLAYRF
jgi:outer membrane autotransporter protein